MALHILAIVGIVFAAAAASLLSAGSYQHTAVIGKQEQYYNTTLAETVSCTTGQLGVFKSLYTPECNGKPGVEFTSDTSSFWPLIPPQSAYGGANVGVPKTFKDLGLSGTAFTNCSDYMYRSALNVTTVLTAGFLGADFVFAECPAMSPAPSNLSAPLDVSACPAVGTGSLPWPYAVCAGKSYFQCAGGFATASSSPAALQAFGGILSLCAASGATTLTSCQNGYWFWASLFIGFDMPSPTTTTDAFSLILGTQCENSGDNQQAILMAQRLTIASQVMIWLGFLLSLGAPVIKTRHYSFIPAAFLLAGAVLSLAGLLVIYRSPVYASIGGACAPTEVCYSSGMSMSLALAGIALGITAAILFCICPYVFKEAFEAEGGRPDKATNNV